MLWYKECPRCKTGDMYLDEDDAKHCMQCGYKQYMSPLADMEPETAKLFNFDEVMAEALSDKRELVTV